MNDFTIEADARQKLLHIVMRGYWTQPIFDEFAKDYSRAIRRIHATGLDHCLVDGRGFAVQSRDISDQFGALIASNAPYFAKRTASVISTQLSKMQAERAGESLDARYFTDMDLARAWLFEAEAKAA